jgi:hypothetical protein
MRVTYQYSPDVLDLVVDPLECPGLETKQLSNPFGLDSREFLAMQNTLIGQKVDAERFYVGRGIPLGSRGAFSLLPAIRDLPASCEVPLSDFETALQAVLSHESCAWVLVCERDCDQDQPVEVQYGSSDGDMKLKELFEFCRHGQPRCPTFMMKSRRQQ